MSNETTDMFLPIIKFRYLRNTPSQSFRSILLCLMLGAITSSILLIDQTFAQGVAARQPLLGSWCGTVISTVDARQIKQNGCLAFNIDGLASVEIDNVTRHGNYRIRFGTGLGRDSDSVLVSFRHPKDELVLRLTQFRNDTLEAVGTLSSQLPSDTSLTFQLKRQNIPASANPVGTLPSLWNSENPSKALERYGLDYPLRPSEIVNPVDRLFFAAFLKDLMDEVAADSQGKIRYLTSDVQVNHVTVIFNNLNNKSSNSEAPSPTSSRSSRTAESERLVADLRLKVGARLKEIHKRYFVPEAQLEVNLQPLSRALINQLSGYVGFDAVKPEFIHQGKVNIKRVQAAAKEAVERLQGVDPPFEFDSQTLQQQDETWQIATRPRLLTSPFPGFVVWDQLRLTIRTLQDGFEIETEVSVWKRKQSSRQAVRVDDVSSWTASAEAKNPGQPTLKMGISGAGPSLYTQCLQSIITAIKK